MFSVNDLTTVKETLFRLEKKVESLNYEGFDPYDVKGHSFFMWALALPRHPFYMNIFRKLILGPLVIGEYLFPKFFRIIFMVKPKKNAKGIGLFVKGYLNLYQVTGNELWLNKAISLLDWLIENKSKGYKHYCWGYPFNWDNFEVIPAYTPASVVSAAVFDAFWHAWLVTGEKRYLNVCSEIALFFIEYLNITEINENTICFSYTPLDHLQVHNTNLMVADCLLKVGYAESNDKFILYGKKAANFALLEQNKDGSIFYYGSAQNYINPNRVDHYHSGFEIRCLLNIWKTTKDVSFLKAYQSYYEFYLKNFIFKKEDFYFPFMYPNKLYPINIHSCAESIILNAELASLDERAIDILDKVTISVISKMIRKDGLFKFMIQKFGSLEVSSNIAYMRWGQAWMFLALSTYLRFKTTNEIK